MHDRIERRIELPAPPDEVWDAITADGWLAEQVSLDLRPGGDATFRDGGRERRGWVEEARPARLLVFWWSEGDDSASRVELALTPLRDGGTILRVLETRPLDVLDLVGTPLHGPGGPLFGPAMLARL